MWVIEKGISPQLRARKSKYPWPDMAVGDSVAVPQEDWVRAYSSAVRYGHSKNQRFSGSIGGLRIWRMQ